MKKRVAFGITLICMVLLTACVREPAQKNAETNLPEESPEMIIRSVTEEAEKRSVDPGFAVPATDGAEDADMVVPAPEGILDPGFDVSMGPEHDEDGTVVITPESQA